MLGNEERVIGENGAAVLGRVIAELAADGIANATEFAEMLRIDADIEPARSAPNEAAAALMLEPITTGETLVARVLIESAIRIRDAHLNDATVERLMTLAAVYAARFDTYLAEREAGSPVAY
ncbi:MAG TPA: hypothetical protein VL856_02920 [Acidimicrobiia bacterium]|nr:hypothetical protein [Acidimicrobiia bacterium]